jgi:hypothetical protein
MAIASTAVLNLSAPIKCRFVAAVTILPLPKVPALAGVCRIIVVVLPTRASPILSFIYAVKIALAKLLAAAVGT